MNKAILGIDTSNYRTSLCLIDLEGRMISEEKRLLTVKPGERGLQQSEAVFQHIQRLPELANQMQWEKFEVVAIAVSVQPRPVEGSYMPVFKVGESWAQGIATFLRIPLYPTSHQEMHIAAGEYSSAKRPEHDRFLAFHLSGGTSELLLCNRTNTGYEINKLGGTLDLHAGQLVDRVGVALGLPFPSGPYLEELAKQSIDSEIRVPSTGKGYDFHLSGAENQLMKLISDPSIHRGAIARATELCIAKSLEKVIRYASEQSHPKEVLIVGGVAANSFIKSRLIERLEHPAVGCSLYFADPAYSGDNAFGVAQIGLQQHLNTNII
ncbi:O-sialoglycoprotein endopeptidase [Ammoniphilus sp. CFH 90114]|uniref:O-sialoglycoprotein endopeptidase n=1 Tax=Ammoniphilus sp. CFH 90114 TaxID=2493665 RepID=UPI00100F50E2|nr:O-sialoglycoprotein endopeptidase [Ammoniphilus sp. CFH 90114]RXT13787.1 O-sialoglycoprotein endopeptidase [Ammoniphilus sp. CFH 90114]